MLDFDRVWYRTGTFEVKLCTFQDPVLDTEMAGYGVFNTESGVREAETRQLHSARILANKFQEYLDNEAQQELEFLRDAPAANDMMA